MTLKKHEEQCGRLKAMARINKMINEKAKKAIQNGEKEFILSISDLIEAIDEEPRKGEEK